MGQRKRNLSAVIAAQLAAVSPMGIVIPATILGFFFGPFCGGWLSNAVRIAGVFWTAAALAVAAGSGVALLGPRHKLDHRLVQLWKTTPR